MICRSAGLAFFKRLERDEHPPRVRRGPASPAASGEADHIIHIRVGLDHVHDFQQLSLHGLKRHVLRRLDASGDPARVLLREEPLGHVV